MPYNNSCVTLVNYATPDPFVVRALGKYYMTYSAQNRIEILAHDSLITFREQAIPHVIWRPPPHGPYAAEIWAPELHSLQGRWWVYFAADDPEQGNISHRMYVLQGPPSDQEPTAGPWEFKGMIKGMDPAQWAIDGTVIDLPSHGLFFVYSGWPLGEQHSDLWQELFIVKLSDPLTAESGPVRISTPDNDWEITTDGAGKHGINEGPQYLCSPNGKWVGLVYACAASWTNDYKEATLRWNGHDPLDPTSWEKSQRPLIKSPPHGHGPWGPGHGCMLNLAGEIVNVYHATDSPEDGWRNRKARLQRVAWSDGGPHMGEFAGDLTDDFDVFARPHSEQSSDHLPHFVALLNSASASA